MAIVHVNSWKTTYKGIVSDEYLSTLKYEEREKLWMKALSSPNFVWVAEVDHQVVGFISGGKERTKEYGYDGELYAIYILKQHQKCGIGKKLVQAFSKEMKEIGNFKSILVWVLSKNPSVQFYQSFKPVKVATAQIDIGKEKHQEIAFGWPNINSLIEG
ncbi:GNAT family N-acetyltransferase [Bacillus sp. RD4P76]|uniref:GNAT family N-acetyltransferase n=2 Tax=Bacillus suaedaesalsae TaxID=2810349 RepID=A0ABS2DGL3_9BACI|nr:GNAT family N-acetyltransferase [Bacillus suaedaesalsae]